jgi:hypothetical protein
VCQRRTDGHGVYRLRDAANYPRLTAASIAAANRVADTVAYCIADTVAKSNAVTVTMMHLVLALVMQHWLVVNDIHLDPFSKAGVVYGSDTTSVLWEATVRAMRAKDPDARVILLGGDMLAHHFTEHASAANKPLEASALATVRTIAGDLDAAFPHAQFLVALGNNDDPCGDYRSETGGAFQTALARIWAPLVNRDGAAPDFLTRFSHGGYYTARLPIGSARAIVLNSVDWSILYGGGCYSHTRDPSGAEFSWLQHELDDLPSGEAAIALMHIPPGYDPRGTELVHRAFAVPFLRPSSNSRLLQLFAAHASALRFVIGAHTHRYDFRLPGGVPMVIASSISPIYRNNPAFFVLDVAGDGTLRDVHPYVYDPGTQDWIAEPSFSSMYGIHGITSGTLTTVADRIRNDAATRAPWQLAYNAWGTDGRMGSNWMLYACAQTELESGYAACAGTVNRTRVLVLVAVGVLICVIVGASFLLRGVTRSR